MFNFTVGRSVLAANVLASQVYSEAIEVNGEKVWPSIVEDFPAQVSSSVSLDSDVLARVSKLVHLFSKTATAASSCVHRSSVESNVASRGFTIEDTHAYIVAWEYPQILRSTLEDPTERTPLAMEIPALPVSPF